MRRPPTCGQRRGESLSAHETSAEAIPGGLATRRRRRGLTAARWPAMAVGAVAVIGLLMIAPATGRAAGADGAFRVRGDTGQVNPARAVLDNDQRVHAPQEHGVHVDKIDGEDAAGLVGEELLPRRAGAARCGVDPGVMQDLPHRGGSDLVAVLDEFALHAPVPPAPDCRLPCGSRACGSRLSRTAVRDAASWCSPTCGRPAAGARRAAPRGSPRRPHSTGAGGPSLDSAASHSRSPGW